MSAVPSGLNTIVVHDEPLLLTETVGGLAVHLTHGQHEKDAGQAAIPDEWFVATRPGWESNIDDYNRELLLERRWSTRTLCGIAWQAMAAGEAGPLHPWQDIALAPTCRRCLTSLDRRFPNPRPDERIGLLAVLIAQVVEEHGSAEVLGVPGDQLKALRAAARRELRRRLGFDGKTYVHNDYMLVTCDEATEEVRLAKAHEIIQSTHQGIAERPPPDNSEWRLHWHTWSTS
ncbi:MAG: hypothetical protein HY997_23530 [Mycolicibacterium neoaurum]|nr:hypothetical protein [Mycolicibacterium neoaurum]